MKETLSIHRLKNLKEAPAFWVLLSLALVLSPHLNRFPGWAIILLSILFTWRILCINNEHLLPPKWLLVFISISSLIGVFITFGTLAGKTAGSISLSILLAIKVHESKTNRDYMLLISLSFFIIVTNFLFSQSIPTVIYMLFSIIILIISMISINQNFAPLSISYKLKFSIKILFQSIPLMLIMFLLFPRIPGPLWQLPNDRQSALTGLSDTMSPGNIANLIQSNAVAFRINFHNAVPAQKNLYWRALTLWYFDGITWEQGKTNPSPLTKLYTSSNKSASYTVTLEPHQKNWLFALDIPSDVPDFVIYTNNYNLRAKHKINNLYKYKVSSVLEYFSQSNIPSWEKSAGLKIPLHTNPKTIKLGKNLAKEYQSDEEIVNHVLELFNQQNFHYTLSPPLTSGFNSVDQFLFDTKRGFCEHYAGSFTLLMRAAGIPARVILGFQGGTINPVNQIMTVRNSDAHAWSEVWLEHRGWVRIDPTAAIAPLRIEQNLNAALDPAENRPLHMHINSGLIKNILFYWDAIDNQWNQWVVGYDNKVQENFLRLLFNEKIDFSKTIFLMVIYFTITMLMLSLFIIKPWQKPKLDTVVKTYNRFCKKLAHQGIRRSAYEEPLDYAKRAINALPDNRHSIELITQLYIKLRYKASHNEKQLHQFKYLTNKFKPGKAEKLQ